MTKSLFRRALALISAPAIIKVRGDVYTGYTGRSRTLDAYDPMAFQYRMGAGMPGTINRSHPASVEAAQMDLDNPVQGYGLAVVVGAANNIRQMAPGDDGLTKIYGISVRPYPVQTNSGGMDAPFGDVVPPPQQPLSVATGAYMMVPILGAPKKGDPVYVWVDATTGDGQPGVDHIQGGFEAVNVGGSTILLADPIGNIQFNGPPDASGIGEVRFRT